MSVSQIWDGSDTRSRVKALLVLKGWSLEDLATHTGITKQAWSKALKRKGALTPSQTVRCAKAFAVTCDDLMLFADEPEDCDQDWMNAAMGEPK